MSIQAVAWALEQDIGDAAAKLVLISLANAMNGKTGRCFPSVDQVCKESSCSESTVRRKLKWLESEAWISIHAEFNQDGRQLANSYTLGCQYDGGRVSHRQGEGSTRDTPEGVSCDTPIKEPEEIPEESILSETGSDDAPKPKKNRISYPDTFEALWKEYPTHPNMSKKEALDVWRKLEEDDRAAVLAAVSGYKAYLAKNPTLETVHLCRFISKRRFDGFVSQQGSSAAPSSFTDDQWRERLNYARDQRRWSVERWGAMPKMDGCIVPAHLIEPADGQGWQIFENR